MLLFAELKRRNVIRVAIAYAITAWLLIEVSATTFPMLRLPGGEGTADWANLFYQTEASSPRLEEETENSLLPKCYLISFMGIK